MKEPTDSSDAQETMSTPPQTEETPRQDAGAVEDSSAAAGPGPGRVARATAWGKASARRAGVVADRERGRHASVDVGFRTVERQRRVAAMVLAGGLAYRIFFWLLALSVVISGVLGFFDPDAVETALENHGVSGWMAQAASALTRSSDGNEWWLLLVGGWLVLWTGYTCSKALGLAHSAIWGVEPPSLQRPLRASLVFSGYTLGFIAAMVAARYVREESEIGGFVGTMLVLGVAFGFWLIASHHLPNAAPGWLELVPGAVVVAVGLQAMHVFTVYFLGPKLESATQLYGVVGVVTTLLFWFYLGGRLIVAGATLNVEFTDLRAARQAAGHAAAEGS